MDRRRFLLTSIAGVFAAPPGAAAQPRGKVPTLGFLLYAPTPDGLTTTWDVLRNGLRERGWIEGQNVAIESRSADGQVGRLPELAADLVARKVDVLVVGGFPAAVRAAQRATATIPIVFVALPVHVAHDMVGNIARPKGNMTGIAYHATPEQGAKELEFYHEMSGKPRRFAVLREAGWESAGSGYVAAAADKLGVTLERVEFSGREGLEPALARIAALRPGALWLIYTPGINSERRRIAEFAMVNRLPSFAAGREYTEAGGLASYAANVSDLFRRSAHHVDRLLRGAKPADLPVEQPTKFELVINLKTAKALGLTIPPSLLLRADQVIE